MIPNISILTERITEATYPSKTYKINFNDTRSRNIINTITLSYAQNAQTVVEEVINSSVLGIAKLGNAKLGNSSVKPPVDISSMDRLGGYVDDIDAVIQAVYLILSTERYEFLIYSWDYGVELVDLFGQPMRYVIAELPMRIKEALIMDDRINDVVDFKFEPHGKTLHVSFTIVSKVGNISTALEVEV